MILSDFSYTTNNLATLLSQLQNGYEEGNDGLNFSITYGKRLRLTDDVFNMEGFMVIGRKEYQSLVERLGTDDVKELAEEVDKQVQQHRGVLFQKQVNTQIEDLQVTSCVLKKAYIGHVKVETYKEVIDHYRADRELLLSLDGSICVKVLFKGNSVYIQGYRGMLLTYEEYSQVDELGGFTPTLESVYTDLKNTEARQTY